MKLSKVGILCSSSLLGLYALTHMWLYYSSKTNPADSGEGGVLLLGFAYPWVLLFLSSSAPLGDTWLRHYPQAGLFVGVFLNAVTIYFVCSGLASIFRRLRPQQNIGAEAASPRPRRSV